MLLKDRDILIEQSGVNVSNNHHPTWAMRRRNLTYLKGQCSQLWKKYSCLAGFFFLLLTHRPIFVEK